MSDPQLQVVLLRLVLAAVLGMVLGLEREWREKAAGFRTLALVSLGSAAFVIVGESLLPDGGARIAAGVVTGVGFLGAGAILRDRGEVIGLTTAAAVWMAAALGMACAVGQLYAAFVGLFLALLVLLLFPAIDLTRYVRDVRNYEIEYHDAGWDPEKLARPFVAAGLSVTPARVSVADGVVVVVWRATGRPERHARVLLELAADPEIARLLVF